MIFINGTLAHVGGQNWEYSQILQHGQFMARITAEDAATSDDYGIVSISDQLRCLLQTRAIRARPIKRPMAKIQRS
ncbi:hypothetical protein Rhsp01_49060 [Rhizobium sp. NBRC 114257]|uniref:Uncharacterized protein n=1 Tax=Rhizobium dioscoreae TaxID=2653122 RepID=A0ABQ0ZA80_9HYPH|nr:hypothetical protein RsS93_50190 [Rhizobium dioscoreae]GLU83730.1 hypothetical protein Rhsp01_49060 [Rhizobium sp. NBRC 114257]